MGLGKKPVLINKMGIEYMQCTCCGETKELNYDNFYKGQSHLKFKTRCILCTKSYYIENSNTRKTYRKNRSSLLKLHNVNTLSQINA